MYNRCLLLAFFLLLIASTGCTNPPLSVDPDNGRIEIPFEHDPAWQDANHFIWAFADENDYKVVETSGGNKTYTAENFEYVISSGHRLLESADGDRVRIDSSQETNKPRVLKITMPDHPTESHTPGRAVFTKQLAAFIARADSRHLPKDLRR